MHAAAGLHCDAASHCDARPQHQPPPACCRGAGRLLLSAGAAPDGLLAVWDWLSGALLWKQQLGADISSVTFTEDGSHVLALGRALFKVWQRGC